MSNSPLSHFITGTVAIGLGTFSAMVLGLLGTMVAVRYMSAEAFGVFVLLQVVSGLFTQIGSFGLNVSVTRFIASEEDLLYKQQLINTVIYFRLITGLGVGLVILIARPALSFIFGSSLPADFVIFVPFLFLLDSLNGLLKSTLQGFFLFTRISITSFAASLLNLLLIMAFVWFLKRGVIGLIFAKLISMSLACGLAYFFIPTRKKLEFDFNKLKKMLIFAFPLHINDVLHLVFSRIDTLMISILLGSADIAYYEIARRIPDALYSLFETFRSVFYPFVSRLLSREEHKKVTLLISNSTRLISFASIFGTLTVLLFGSDLIRLLFSEKYLPSVSAFIVLMMAANISFVSNILGTSLVATGDTNKPAIINTVHSAISLIGNVIFIPLFGITGAAFASLAGNAMSNPLNVFFLRKRIKVEVHQYLKPILVFVGCFILVLFWGPITFVQKILIISLFLVACVSLSVITVEDLTVLVREIKLMAIRLLQSPRSEKTKI